MSKLAIDEIFRLKKLGWDSGYVDDLGVWHKKGDSSIEISFPEEAYLALTSAQIKRDPWEHHRGIEIEKCIKENGHSLIWEIGAGDGSVSDHLRSNGIEVICVEPIYGGARLLAEKGAISYCLTLGELEFPDNSISAIGMFDVLEHIDDASATISEIHRVLAPGGLFVCTVPAYNFLFSDFDVAIGHFRRYSKHSLQSLMRTKNFTEISTHFLFAILVPPAFLLRALPYRLGRRNSYTQEKKIKGLETKILSKISKFVGLWFKLESVLRIPVGLSILSAWSKDKS